MCSNAFKHLRSLGVSNARSSIPAGPMRPVRTPRPRPYAPHTRHAEFEQVFERGPAAHYRPGMTSKQEPTGTNLAELPDGPPDATGLTPRQQRILAHLRDCIEKRGYPPSMREIGSAVGLTSTSSVAHQLKVLVQKGFIKRDPHRPRALEVFLPEVLAARKAISSADEDLTIEQADFGDEYTHLRILFPRSRAEARAGDIIQTGMHITNSEVGLRAVHIEPLVFRLVCTNGLVRPEGGGRTSIRHVGNPARLKDSVARAIEDAKRTDIAATGEIRVDFLTQWKEKHYNSGASVNPPGVMASALNVAVLKLQGKEFKDGIFKGTYGNAIYLPIPFIDSTNFEQVFEPVKDKPGYYSVTATVTPEEAQASFFK